VPLAFQSAPNLHGPNHRARVQANLKHSTGANPKPTAQVRTQHRHRWLRACSILPTATSHRVRESTKKRLSFIVLELANIDGGVARAAVATHMAAVCLLKSCCHSIGSV
jgi:hypothetical protein